MNDIMKANIIHVVSVTLLEDIPSCIFYRTGNVWRNNRFKIIPTEKVKSIVCQCVENGANIDTIVNDSGKIHVCFTLNKLMRKIKCRKNYMEEN